MGKVGGVCVCVASGEGGIGCGLGERRISDWERARERRGRERRVLEWASVSGACWTVHCRRSEGGGCVVCVEGILWEQEEIVFILIRDWQLWHIYREFMIQ